MLYNVNTVTKVTKVTFSGSLQPLAGCRPSRFPVSRRRDMPRFPLFSRFYING